MYVEELNREQIDQLKESYAAQLYDTGDYKDIGISYNELLNSHVSIPDDIIFEHYAGISFSEDDFFS